MAFGHLNHGKPPLEVSVVTGASSDIVEFTAGGAIVAGDVVAFDVAGQTGEAQTQVVIQAATSSAAAIGVCPLNTSDPYAPPARVDMACGRGR